MELYKYTQNCKLGTMKSGEENWWSRFAIRRQIFSELHHGLALLREYSPNTRTQKLLMLFARNTRIQILLRLFAGKQLSEDWCTLSDQLVQHRSGQKNYALQFCELHNCTTRVNYSVSAAPQSEFQCHSC